MTVWLVRTGSHGEHEQKFLQEKRIYVTWDDLNVDVSKLTQREELSAALLERYPNSKPKTIQNWTSQVWPFAHEFAIGDWVAVPLKSQRAIQFGEVTSDYHFEKKGPSPYFHWRSVKWISEAVPRDHFGKDLLNTLGSAMTICRVKNNNAEQRLFAMHRNGWKQESNKSLTTAKAITSEYAPGEESQIEVDLEEAADDAIAQLIMGKFKGHGLARLVEAILRAQGYTTWRSPEGADGGADILAGAGPLGFGSPRLCVEVKSESNPIDRPTVDKLLGAVTKFGAQEGLFVSWSGFKTNVQKELASSFFRVRLWTQKELLESLFAVYEKLDPDIKAELPLKQIWTVALHEED